MNTFIQKKNPISITRNQKNLKSNNVRDGEFSRDRRNSNIWYVSSIIIIRKLKSAD